MSAQPGFQSTTFAFTVSQSCVCLFLFPRRKQQHDKAFDEYMSVRKAIFKELELEVALVASHAKDKTVSAKQNRVIENTTHCEKLDSDRLQDIACLSLFSILHWMF